MFGTKSLLALSALTVVCTLDFFLASLMRPLTVLLYDSVKKGQLIFWISFCLFGRLLFFFMLFICLFFVFLPSWEHSLLCTYISLFLGTRLRGLRFFLHLLWLLIFFCIFFENFFKLFLLIRLSIESVEVHLVNRAQIWDFRRNTCLAELTELFPIAAFVESLHMLSIKYFCPFHFWGHDKLSMLKKDPILFFCF